jgi:hypothetical protein
MIQPSAPAAADGPLILADIGGYTPFLHSVAEAHRDDAFANGQIPDAYGLVSSLLVGIVDRLVPPFTLSKLEGDAVFAFAVADADVPRGQALLDCIAACYTEFRSRLAQAHEVWTCTCDACARIDGLELKFVLHAGPFVIQSIAGSRERTGSDVVMAHRLRKTTAADAVGQGAYALLTDVAAARFGVPTAGAVALTETVDHYAPIQLHAYALHPS